MALPTPEQHQKFARARDEMLAAEKHLKAAEKLFDEIGEGGFSSDCYSLWEAVRDMVPWGKMGVK